MTTTLSVQTTRHNATTNQYIPEFVSESHASLQEAVDIEDVWDVGLSSEPVIVEYSYTIIDRWASQKSGGLGQAQKQQKTFSRHNWLFFVTTIVLVFYSKHSIQNQQILIFRCFKSHAVFPIQNLDNPTKRGSNPSTTVKSSMRVTRESATDLNSMETWSMECWCSDIHGFNPQDIHVCLSSIPHLMIQYASI